MRTVLTFLMLSSFVIAQVGGKSGIGGKGGIGRGFTGGGEPTFTDIQGAWGSQASSGTTLSVTLSSNPATGNAVVCEVQLYPSALTVTSVLDANSNAYTQTPNSPSNVQSGSVPVFLFYLLNAPSNANKVITVTASGTITFASDVGCEEFHRSTGTWTFDKDVAGNAASGAVVNTPSITSTVAGELEFGAVYAQEAFNTGAANSPWTQATMGVGNCSGSPPCSGYAAYILSSSGSSTALNFTLANGSTGSWNSMAMALK